MSTHARTCLCGLFLLTLTLCTVLMPGEARGQSEPVRDVIEELEQTTDYRFLYRDALIAGHRVTVDVSGASDQAKVDRLAAAAQGTGLVFRIDHDRRQVIVTQASAKAPDVVGGYVVDGQTGTRLPLATVLWKTGRGQAGTATGTDGRFQIQLDDRWEASDTLVVRASYVGYAPRIVHVALSPPPGEVPIRLFPRETQAPEVVVQTEALIAGLDTTWNDLLRAERYAPLGEANVLRALQPLPSVGVTGALTGGLVVRGSRPDGFRVLLDGAPIYNAHHLFGMFDAFNADALQTVGLFYDVAPATYAAPPGGTLAFRTRTGSQKDLRTTIHASNTAVSGTVEGPWDDGRGSVLVSARGSTLNLVDILNNDELVEQGLDVDRPREPLPADAVREIGTGTTRPLNPSGSFFDVHVNAYNERPSGRRITLSLYTGTDDADQGLLRLVRNPNDDRRFAIDTSRTSDRWGNTSGSLQIDEPLSDRSYGRLTVAGSRYFSRYRKDDFVYLRQQRNGRNRFFVDAYASENTLHEWSMEPRVDVALPDNGIASIGAAVYLYDVEFEEESALGSPFEVERQAARVDLFGHLDVSPGPVDVSLGLRTHGYTDGRYLRVSPRLRVRAWPEEPVSVGLGYTRSHQFLHRLDIVGETSSAVWVPSTEGQPPGRVDHLSGGIYLTPPVGPALQIEAYVKAHENIRLHETFARFVPGDRSVLFAPWSLNNTSRARGLEVLARQPVGAFSLTTGYTWSRVVIDRLGQPTQSAPWDRRHQVTSRLGMDLGPWSAALTGTYATGTPSDYAGLVDGEPPRIGDTARLDASLQYQRSTEALDLKLRAAVYNLTDRDNPWYRSPALYWTRPGGRGSRLESDFAVLDTYDLGLQPSVAVSITF